MLRRVQGGLQRLERDSILLKLFQAALKVDQAQRAWEIAKDMQMTKIIQGSIFILKTIAGFTDLEEIVAKTANRF